MVHVLCSEKDRCADGSWTAALIDNGFRACKTIEIHALCSMFYVPIKTTAPIDFNHV